MGWHRAREGGKQACVNNPLFSGKKRWKKGCTHRSVSSHQPTLRKAQPRSWAWTKGVFLPKSCGRVKSRSPVCSPQGNLQMFARWNPGWFCCRGMFCKGVLSTASCTEVPKKQKENKENKKKKSNCADRGFCISVPSENPTTFC